MGIETMGSYGMKSARVYTKGFTLIASLLLLLLLSAMSVGLLMMVNTEGKVGGADLQNDVAYHSAEGGIEKMASDLAATFQNSQVPAASDICNVGLPTTNGPVMAGVTWKDYSVTPASGCSGALEKVWGQISSGPEGGLYAQIIPVNMLATAAMLGGQEVSMVRSAQVALIPAFQFGVFSEGDLSFFSGPNFDMVGPVHTNGDLYPFVGDGSTLVFHNKLEVYGNVVRTQLANGWGAGTGYTGTVWIPTAGNGCTALTAAGKCTAMAAIGANYGDGSVEGAGGNPPASTYIPTVVGSDTWTPFSKTTTNLQLINGNYGNTGLHEAGTGAKKLSMPFVGGNVLPYEILRRPAPGEDSTSALGTSREYNMAQIRVLLSDDPTEFTNGTGYTDLDNVRLANLTAAQLALQGGTAPANPYPWGFTIPAANLPPVASFGAPTAGNTFNLYFAAASDEVPIPAPCANTIGPCLGTEWPNAPLPWVDPNPVNQSKEGLQPSLWGPIYLNLPNPTINLCPPNTYPLLAGVVLPPGCVAGAYPYYASPNASSTANNSNTSTAWSLIDGYLRVEYRDANGNWNPVTREWLGLGFARDVAPSTAPGTNPINPNAILLLQEPADRGNVGARNSVGTAPTCTTKKVGGVNYCQNWSGAAPQLTADLAWVTAKGTFIDWAFGLTPNAPVAPPTANFTPQSLTQYNWYPINFYDAREGEVRDNQVADNSCSTNGVMNAVEIDVGNLKKWLQGNSGINPTSGVSSGPNVDYLEQNGYVLYFSDRRGMLLNPNKTGPHPAFTKSGDAGLEDVINSANAAGTPDDGLEPPAANSPEDVNQNGVLDDFGPANEGLGFYGTVATAGKNLNTQIISTNPKPDPFGTAAGARIASCSVTGRKNWVSGARHVLRLVDGSIGNLPLRPAPIVVTNADGSTTNYWGGFTVASENPVYIWGDYNTNAADFGNADQIGKYAASSVIADAVTFLSNSWSDFASYGIGGDGTVTNPGNRNATNAYYRLAIAGGKNNHFAHPANTYQDFGTDGGVHNFLRYLENWGGQALNYKGSLVSLYYSTYATGVYKCCTDVYSPPTRNYSFDLDFTKPEGLPPGTPMFRDVESLGYRQLFTARTN